MEEAGVVEEIPPEEVHSTNITYNMTHHSVAEESSVSTMVRPMFNASAKSPNVLFE